MADKGVARKGDTGSHGGTITTGSGKVFVNDRPMARVGDTYACPKHGNNPIISGVQTVFGEGMLAAHVGSKTACGATITSGSPDTFVDDSASVVGTLYAAAATNIATDAGGIVWNGDAALQHLREHSHQNPQHRCARYVREAIEAGGVRMTRPASGSAMDYGPHLENAGFSPVEAGGAPQAGDVVIIQSPGESNPHGHMAMYDGTQWISDYRQGADFYPNQRYRNARTQYTIYRRP
jgi:uncharacterized Zn-binding protein involved in type VI secretion